MPKSWDELEIIVSDLFSEFWKDPYTQRNGRLGQSQQGVDIFGQPDQSSRWAGVQVKHKEPGSNVTEEEIRAEIAKADSFNPALDRFTIVTTAPSDSAIQEVARAITEERRAVGDFGVHVWGWAEVERRLADYPHLLKKHYSEFYEHVDVEKGQGRELEAMAERVRETTASRGRAKALVRIKNPDSGLVENCYGRISGIIWEMTNTVNNQLQVWDYPMYEGDDFFLHWSGHGSRHHNFRTEAILDVATMAAGDADYALATVDYGGRPARLSAGQSYRITLEIAADNAAPITRTYRLCLSTDAIDLGTDAGGQRLFGIADTAVPPNVVFQDVIDTL